MEWLMELLNTTSGHWYDCGGRVVPSVTTILNILDKPMLHEWRLKQGYKADVVTRDACMVGNIVHDVLCRVARGETVELDDVYLYKSKEVWLTDEMFKAIKSGVEWFKDTLIEGHDILATEKQLSHPDYNFAGTVDLAVKIEDETWLIDYKTSKQLDENVDLQLTAYAMLWNANYPDNQVTRIGALNCKKAWVSKPSAILKKYKLVEDHWNAVMTLWSRKKQKPNMKYSGTKVFKLLSGIEINDIVIAEEVECSGI